MNVDCGVITRLNVDLGRSGNVDRNSEDYLVPRLKQLRETWARSFGEGSGDKVRWVHLMCDMDTPLSYLDEAESVLSKLPVDSQIILTEKQWDARQEVLDYRDSYALFGGQDLQDEQYTHLHLTVLDSDDVVSKKYFDHSAGVAASKWSHDENAAFVLICENGYVWDQVNRSLNKVHATSLKKGFVSSGCYSVCMPIESKLFPKERYLFGDGTCFCKMLTEHNGFSLGSDFSKTLEDSSNVVPISRLSGCFASKP